MDAPILESEITAIITTKSGKSPGLDGFPVKYYKRNIIDVLAHILTRVCAAALELEQLPDTFTETLISFILKKDRDPTDLGSFRPIILVGVDL